MSQIVRAAIVQTEWTGDKKSMVAKNAGYARRAAEDGAQVMCFQELFHAPYFCQVQEDDHFDYAEAIPDGETTYQMAELAKETSMVLVGAINRVGREPFGDNDFYGSSYFVDPRGEMVGEQASNVEEELLIRDLDMDMIETVRKTWAFYRDRRPDAYGPLVAP